MKIRIETYSAARYLVTQFDISIRTDKGDVVRKIETGREVLYDFYKNKMPCSSIIEFAWARSKENHTLNVIKYTFCVLLLQ